MEEENPQQEKPAQQGRYALPFAPDPENDSGDDEQQCFDDYKVGIGIPGENPKEIDDDRRIK